jgi:hypothetical protein
MLFPLSYRMHQTLFRVVRPSATRSGHDADLGASRWESSISVEAHSLRNRSRIRAGVLYGWAVVWESKAFAIDVLAVVECEPGCLTHEIPVVASCALLANTDHDAEDLFGHRCSSSDQVAAKARNLRKRKAGRRCDRLFDFSSGLQ